MATPRSRASCGPAGWYGMPSSTIRPASGCSAPLRIFIRVDLPAPFSPTRAWTSPGATSRETPRSARVGPKLLWIASMRSRGSGGGAATGGCLGSVAQVRLEVAGVERLDGRVVEVLGRRHLQVGVLRPLLRQRLAVEL